MQVDGILLFFYNIIWIYREGPNKLTLHLERIELFLAGSEASPSLRPGILCLINEEDWELHDNEKYLIQDNDDIVFISTLHGG